MSIGASDDECVAIEHPRIQDKDPRTDEQIAANNARSVLKMRSVLTKGRELLLFPGAGLCRSRDGVRILVDRSFDHLAPVLLACKISSPNRMCSTLTMRCRRGGHFCTTATTRGITPHNGRRFSPCANRRRQSCIRKASQSISTSTSKRDMACVENCWIWSMQEQLR